MDESPRRKEFEAWYRGCLELNLLTDQRDTEGHPYYLERPAREAWGAWSTAWNTATSPKEERRGFKAAVKLLEGHYG